MLIGFVADESDAIVTQVITSEFSTVNIKYSPSADKQKNSSSNGFMSGQFVVLYDVDRSFSAGEVQVTTAYKR